MNTYQETTMPIEDKELVAIKTSSFASEPSRRPSKVHVTIKHTLYKINRT